MNVIISLLLSIAIVAILAWLGDWGGTRSRNRVMKYWQQYTPLCCPRCGTDYLPDSAHGEWSTDHGPGGWTFTCQFCGEIAYFRHEPGQPTFAQLAQQPRRCIECGDVFVGVPDSTCPVCGLNRQELAHNKA